MKIAYLDAASGISGDMTLGALVDAGVPLEALQEGIDSLGLPSCLLVAEETIKKGFRATQITVQHEPEHAHRHLHHITDMIDASTLTPAQQDLAKRIFTRLGEAEAKVHGTTLRKVHFHEVGAVDSIADIVGAAIAFDLLGAERIVASPIPTGHGFINIAHGRCSIPAPATGELLRGIPLAACDVEAELTTPTGAAIVATLVDEFGPVPPMSIESIGYGAGQRDLDQQANLLRLMVGEANDSVAAEQLWMLETNLDDVTGELIGHCTERLFTAGALDVFTTPIGMKKNRPGSMISVLCQPACIGKLEKILFHETTTLGVRRYAVSRRSLQRVSHDVSTELGSITGKVAWLPDGSVSFAPEFESCRAISEDRSVSLVDVYRVAQSAFDPDQISKPDDASK